MSSPTPIRSRIADRGRRALPALTTALLALGITVVASAAPQVPRTAFVDHVYVDPNFGADSEAYDLNPGGSATTVPPLGSHPYIDPLTQSRPIHGALQHAPYPFRTLSGSQGALAYIDALMPTLPWSLEQDRTVTHVVIHCLPGMYGPTTAAGVAVPLDLRNGLPFNGETFPILLDRDRICLQGTSALDTCSGATLLHGSWCYNDQPGGCPDLLPGFPGEAGKGRRFNLETAPDAQGGVLRSNLQTFLFVFPGELLPAAPGAPMSELPAREMDSRLREQEVNR